MILLLANAWAHVPHEVVASVAAPPDLRSASWYLMQGSPLLRSTDQGRTWYMVGGAPTGDDLVDLAWIEPGWIVARSETQLWWTEDDGATWKVEPLPAEIADMEGGEQLILVGDGIWEGNPGTLKRVTEGVFADVGEGGVALTVTGDVYRRQDSWTQVTTLPSARLVIADGDVLYSATKDGRVFRYDGQWTPCGEVSAGDIYHLAADGKGGLLATGYDHAPYFSPDHCTSWESPFPPDKASYSGNGGVDVPSKAFTVLKAAGDQWVVGGWFGYWHSDDAGKTWQESRILGSDFIRGLAFSGPEQIYLGGYSYGVAWTDNKGLKFTSSNLGLTPPNIQGITPVAGSEVVHAIANHEGYTSEDGGVHWTKWPLNEEMVHLDQVVVLPDGSLFLLSTLGAQFSLDQGTSLTDIPGLPKQDYTSLAVSGTLLAAGSAEGLWVSEDAGESWSSWYTSTGAMAGPVADNDGFWVGDSTGLHHRGITMADIAAPALPALLAVADDGTLFFATLDSRLYRYDQGNWLLLGQLPAPVDTLVASPDFSTHPLLLAGTHDGIWQVADARAERPTLERWGQWERVDYSASHDFNQWIPEVSHSHPQEDANGGMVQSVPAGTSVQVWIQGTTLQLRGKSVGGAQVEVDLDGTPVGTVGMEANDRIRKVWQVDGLSEGWHQVTLVGVTSGFSVDTLDGITGETPEDSGIPAVKKPSEEASCGCQHGSATLFLGLALLRRRRIAR